MVYTFSECPHQLFPIQYIMVHQLLGVEWRKKRHKKRKKAYKKRIREGET